MIEIGSSKTDPVKNFANFHRPVSICSGIYSSRAKTMEKGEF